jgi:hypothetical protein
MIGSLSLFTHLHLCRKGGLGTLSQLANALFVTSQRRAWIALILFPAAAYAGPLPACTSPFQYSCVNTTAGGYTIVTPLASTGSTEITGYNSSNSVIFDETIPLPPNGTGITDQYVQSTLAYAEAQVAIQTGQAGSLPACTGASQSACLQTFSGSPASVVSTNAVTWSYSAVDSPATATTDEYSTTLVTKLNGGQLTSQTFAAPFSDPSVQSAISAADLTLTGDGAMYGAPSLTSNSSSLAGSELSYVETGEGGASFNITATETFGPGYIWACHAQLSGLGYGPCGSLLDGDSVFPFVEGQLDITTLDQNDIDIDRTVTTTDTYLVDQTYEIDGTTNVAATPEPDSLLLLGTGLAGLAFRLRPVLRRKKRQRPESDDQTH